MRIIGVGVVSFAVLLMYAPLSYAQTLIVGNKREHTVSFIDLNSGQEFARTQTGKAPHEVAVSPDGTTAAIVSYREQSFVGNEIHVFDVLSGKKTGVIDLGKNTAPHGLKWIPDTNMVIATTESSQSVVLVDVAKMEMLKSVKTKQRGSHMVALATDNKRAFVANISAGSFTVIDLATFEKIKDVKAGDGTEAITVSPDGKRIWVGNNQSKSIMIFDAETYEKLNEIKTKGIPIRVEFSPNGASVVVSEPDLSRVSVYDAVSHKFLKAIDLTNMDAKVPVTMLFSPDGTKLWVAATGSAKVVEVDASKWTLARLIDAGEGSDGLGFSPLRYIAQPPE